MTLTFNGGPRQRGIVLGIHALPFILLQYSAGSWSDRLGRLKLLIPGSIGYGLLLSAAGYIGERGFAATGFTFLLLGVFSGLTGPSNAALLGDLVAPRQNGIAMAVFNFMGNLGIISGPLLAGVVMEHLRSSHAFLAAGFVELLSLGVNLYLLKRFNLLSTISRKN
jgi:MFS family permease